MFFFSFLPIDSLSQVGSNTLLFISFPCIVSLLLVLGRIYYPWCMAAAKLSRLLTGGKQLLF